MLFRSTWGYQSVFDDENSFKNSSIPTILNFSFPHPLRTVSAGPDYFTVLDNIGHLYCWGYKFSTEIIKIHLPPIFDVASGPHGTFALAYNGSIYHFENNTTPPSKLNYRNIISIPSYLKQANDYLFISRGKRKNNFRKINLTFLYIHSIIP